MILYKYGMYVRPFDLDYQPMKNLEKVKNESVTCYDYLYYSVKLTAEEVHEYELEYKGEVNEE